MHDDTAQFRDEQREHARALASDAELQEVNARVTTVSDQHHYSYVWRWLGLPIIQMPTDVVALQEIVWEQRPQVVVETGVARGGSVLLYASILQLLGEGTVVAIDIDIRAHNRRGIEEHPLAHRVQLIEGSSVDDAVLTEVRERIGSAEPVMVVLDSNHTHEHVLEELRRYGPLVSKGQYLVVADTVIEHLPLQSHRPRPWGPGDNPATAVAVYLQETDRFVVDEEVNGKLLMTSNPGGYLRCVKD